MRVDSGTRDLRDRLRAASVFREFEKNRLTLCAKRGNAGDGHVGVAREKKRETIRERFGLARLHDPYPGRCCQSAFNVLQQNFGGRIFEIHVRVLQPPVEFGHQVGQARLRSFECLAQKLCQRLARLLRPSRPSRTSRSRI